MWFYNSDFSVHDGKVNYEDVTACSHQNGEVPEWVYFKNVVVGGALV